MPSLLTGPRVEEAMWRSIRWLDRCIAFHEKSGRNTTQNLFAIIQGGLKPNLRDICLNEMIKRKDHVPGYAVGGLSGGEAKGNLKIIKKSFMLTEQIRCFLENVRFYGFLVQNATINLFQC